jgi:prephenate dehydrogenase
MGEHDLFQKIGFIGLGLIGGSIAKKIHTLYPDVTIIATAGHQETITEAYGEHLISNQNLCEIKDFYDCDYIFLCTPVKRNIEYLRQLKGNIKNGCIITDVGSVKTDIHEEVTALAMEDCFIGGHPMAGSEKTGLKNANEYLLENAYYILTPTTKTSPERLEEFRSLVTQLGAVALVLDYHLHDYATAAISHLPHIIAYSLVNLVKKSDDANETMKTIAAGGFKDLTRIASSSPVYQTEPAHILKTHKNMYRFHLSWNEDPCYSQIIPYTEYLQRSPDNHDLSGSFQAHVHAACSDLP